MNSHSNTILSRRAGIASDFQWRYQTQGVLQPAQSKPKIMVSAGRSDSPVMEIKNLWRWSGQISLLHPGSWCDTSGVRIALIPKRLNKLGDQEGWHIGLGEERVIKLYSHCWDRQQQLSELYIASGELFNRKINIWCEVRCSEMWNDNQDSCLFLSQARSSVT